MGLSTAVLCAVIIAVPATVFAEDEDPDCTKSQVCVDQDASKCGDKDSDCLGALCDCDKKQIGTKCFCTDNLIP